MVAKFRTVAKVQARNLLLLIGMLLAVSLGLSSGLSSNLAKLSWPNTTVDLACQKVFQSEPWAAFELRDYCSLKAATSNSTKYPSAADWVPCAQLRRIQRNNTLIIANVNCGFVDFAVNFWRSYRRLGLSNILFLAEDCRAYSTLMALVGADHVAPPLYPPLDHTELAGQAWGSPGYAKLMLRRPMYLQYFTRAGYRVLWQDLDSVPLRDPFDVMPAGIDVVVTTGNPDLVCSGPLRTQQNPSEQISSEPNRACTKKPLEVCGCFIFLKGGSPAVEWLLDRWVYHLEGESYNQPALNRAISDALNKTIYGSTSFVHVVLPQRLFPSGAMYEEMAASAAWCHASYQEPVGKQAKREFLERRGLWAVGASSIECV